MHTPTLIQTAFTAASLIAGAAAAPVRRGSVVDDGFPSAPPSRRGSFVGDELPLSRRASIVDLPTPPSRRGSVVDETASLSASRRGSLAGANDITASRRRSLASEDVQPARRSSMANPGDIFAARKRSVLAEDAPVRRSSVAGPADITASRRRSLAPEDAYEFPARRSLAAPSAADIFAARSRGSAPGSPAPLQVKVDVQTEEADEDESPFVQSPVSLSNAPTAADIFNARRRSATPEAPARRSSLAPSAADIVASRRRSAVEMPTESLNRRSSAAPTPADIFNARRRSAIPEPADPQLARRSSLAAPQDIVSSRRRSFANGDNTPSRRSSLANELPVWRTSFGAAPPAGGSVVVEEEVAPEDDVPEASTSASPAIAIIPLHKRAENPLAHEDGTVNWHAATAHLDHINIKYEKGIIAHQVNKGEPLLDARHYSPEELVEREEVLAKRATEGLAEEAEAIEESGEDDLPTVEDDFMAGATEFSVGNPNLAAFKSKAVKRQSGVKLTAYNNDLLWAGPVTIGSNAQPFILDFDTGSADTWVPSKNCKSSACAKHHKYDPSASETSDLMSDNKLSIQYGDGSTTTGQVYQDNLTIAGMTAKDQTIGVATTLSSSFANDPHDGIMGMGYQSISQMNEAPVFQTLMKQNKVSKAQFSFNLNSGGGSELYLGGANPNKYKGNMEWHDVVSESYWVLQADAQVNGKTAADDFYAIVDTGTTVVVAPTAQAKEFWSNVEGSQPYSGGYYTFPCDSAPEVSFSFGGKKWEMSEGNLNLGATQAGSDRCVGSIVGMDVGVSAWIIGDSFLKDVYTTFDFDKNRVGFAEKSDS